MQKKSAHQPENHHFKLKQKVKMSKFCAIFAFKMNSKGIVAYFSYDVIL